MKDVVWTPTEEYIAKANISRFMNKYDIKTYDELIAKSNDDLEWFWDAVMKDLNIEWYKPYEKILDSSKGIQWTKWFIGGKTNIVHNCIDKHIISNKKDNIAIIWENENGDDKKLTYEELFLKVNKFSNALKELGVKKGDRVGIYMPMIPEIVIAFLGTMKISAISIPIFSGFGGHALAQRLNIAGAKVLVTADGSVRRGKTYEIKTRYQAKSSAGTLERIGKEKKWVASLAKSQWSVAPGQSLVVFSGDEIIGGGIIEKAEKKGKN